MTSFREQAIKDAAEALQVDPQVIRFQISSGKVSGRSYAVSQREATLKLEDALRDVIFASDGLVDEAYLRDARAALNAVKEG